MAYYLRSFVQILEEVLHPDQHYRNWVLDHDKIQQVQSLWEIASFLRDFLDNSSPLVLYRIANLEDQIMDAAEKAEDTLETYLTSELVSSPEGQAFIISPPNIEEAIQAFEDARKEVVKIMDAKPVQRPDDGVPLPVSTTRYPNHNNVVVGVTKDLNQLRSRLTSQVSGLDIIPIVGMGGMGKTTLAQTLYDEFSSTSISHFDCFAWVTVSQTYDSQQILSTILACMSDKTEQQKTQQHNDEKTEQHDDEVVVKLHKTLYGRRYLIVLDDIWSTKAWDDFQRAFPQDTKGSKIIFTTRENILASYVNSKCHEMQLINEDNSWELLRGKVFGEESCPDVFEEVGKRIAISCGGLPLALQVVGGFLSQSQKSIDFWKHVANNVRSFIARADDQFSGIFSWSFAHLPHYLKPCFLYMSGFPEDGAIPASKIIKLWIAEGFLHPIRDKSLEEAGMIHLNALVNRNLISVREKGKNGKVRSYGIHDLLKNLCLRKAQGKEFLNFKAFKALQTENLQKDVLFRGRIVSVEAHVRSHTVTPLTRSFRSHASSTNNTILSYLCFKLSLLRVLDLRFATHFHEFPEEILQLVNLRYLDLWNMNCRPASLSVLKNLRTLIISDITSLAMLSDMPQLRHLKFARMEEYSELPYGVHENLQSLSKVPAKEVKKLLGKLPNLRKLVIDYLLGFEFIDLTCFHNLESLNCLHGSFSNNMTFPVSLKKLSLRFCETGQSLLDAIGVLPNLQILQIYTSFTNMDWETSEGGFRALQYLEINHWNLENWVATDVHFPVLEHLVLEKCLYLIEIPSDFGSIETLETIEVGFCSPSVFRSARRILEEQYQFGNTIQLWLRGDLVQVYDEEVDWKIEEEEAVRAPEAQAKVVRGVRKKTSLFFKKMLGKH